MFGAIGSLLASMFSLHHYYWAASVRRGIGLSYVFAISLILTISFLGFSIDSIGVDQILALFNTSTDIPDGAKSIFNLIQPQIFVFVALPLFVSIFISLTIINVAILTSVFIGQPINCLYGERFDFEQVLRINSYVTVLSLLISIVTALIFPSLTEKTGAVFFGFVVFYNFYAILYQKIDL